MPGHGSSGRPTGRPDVAKTGDRNHPRCIERKTGDFHDLVSRGSPHHIVGPDEARSPPGGIGMTLPKAIARAHEVPVPNGERARTMAGITAPQGSLQR